MGKYMRKASKEFSLTARTHKPIKLVWHAHVQL